MVNSQYFTIDHSHDCCSWLKKYKWVTQRCWVKV